MSDEVTRLAEGLAALGVGAGDAVAIFLPMSPEVAIASHACAHLGAIQVPIFSGFAAPAVAARLRDSDAKVVITADGSLRRGKELAMKAVVDEALASRRRSSTWSSGGGSAATSRWRKGATSSGTSSPPRSRATLAPLEVDSETPYLLTYTSGTTGRPKGIVHVQGGFLVSIAREVAYQADAHPDDTILFSTDMGWIMGPWTVVGGGAVGSRLVFMEGAPDWPDDRLWTLCERGARVDARLLAHADPRAHAARRARRPISRRCARSSRPASRGTPARTAGSSSTSAAAAARSSTAREAPRSARASSRPTPAEPIKECSLGGPALGMAMDVVDAEGNSVRGEVGELVCRKPFPGMTRGFWRDPERYLETYWSRLPGIWVHGDWASVDEDGYWFLHGRSDDTLNIAGKRIGPAELESAAVAHPAVAEAAAVGVPHEVKGEVAWVFCVPAPGIEPSDELAAEVRGARGGRPRQGVRARPRLLRARAAEDAQRQDRAPRRARPGHGRGSRRSIVR